MSDKYEVTYARINAAWRNFRHGKKSSPMIDEFEYSLETNLQCLTDKINRRTYRHGSYRKVIVREKKRRDLAVVRVRDRVVHRLVYDYLVDLFDVSFDPDVWSCRKGKGLHKCLTRTKQLLQKHPESYVWRMDITKFFDSVNHNKLRRCLSRKVQDSQFSWLCGEIINSYHGGGAFTG